MRLNKSVYSPVFTHEGAPSTKVPAFDRLKRTVLACMLWEDTFYEDGVKVADRIEELCKIVKPEKIVELALLAHGKYRLRHVPLLLLLQAIKNKAAIKKEDFFIICNRPDQMTELLAMYWKDGKKPIPAKMKKGLAFAFTRFDEYQLAKYNRDDKIKLRDVLFLVHAKPKDEEQGEIWKRLISNTLKTPDTWETRLSAGEDKKDSFSQLLEENKMGKLAILRNLRNMHDAGCDKDLVKKRMLENNLPLLPFQFISAAKECSQWEDIIDAAMVDSASKKPKLLGHSLILVDVSGSMDMGTAGKSKNTRMDAACAFAILLREVCYEATILSFSDKTMMVPNRRGMALRDAIVNSQPHSSTHLGMALQLCIQGKLFNGVSRVIVISDEQTHEIPPQIPCQRCYVLNVGTYENGIKNNGQWLTINGFAEASIDYIKEIEDDPDLK